MKAGYMVLAFMTFFFGLAYFPLFFTTGYFLCLFIAGFKTLKRLYKRSDCSVTLKILLTFPAFLLFLVLYVFWGVVFAAMMLSIPILAVIFSVAVWKRGYNGFRKLICFDVYLSAHDEGPVAILNELGYYASPFCCI